MTSGPECPPSGTSSTYPWTSSRSTAASSRTWRMTRSISRWCGAINDVGHVMGKKTIGEAVDGEMGLAALREIGVDFAQGHYLSPPGLFLEQVSGGIAR